MSFRILILLVALAAGFVPAQADEQLYGQEDLGQSEKLREFQEFQEAQYNEPQIAPSEAAAIAQDAIPGSRVLRVKLTASGDYAVTLKVKGSVVKVMVSGVDGSIL